MTVKFKGQTSALLRDLCLELNIKLDLKASEDILKTFFNIVQEDLCEDKSIELLTNLPNSLKAFYSIHKRQINDLENGIKVSFDKSFHSPSPLFTERKSRSTLLSILKVLSKHYPSQHLLKIYSALPLCLFYEANTMQKRSSIAV